MSLSKEMQRSMSIQMELNRIQQEMATARGRMEVSRDILSSLPPLVDSDLIQSMPVGIGG
jgi:hypothetical protein